MTTNTSSPRVVVGVDGTPASISGVKYAALEAHRSGATLLIVHVTPGYGDSQAGTLPIIDGGTLRAYGRKLLGETESTALGVAAGLQVECQLLTGATVPTLVDAARAASLLVLGAERRSFLGRVWTGDVVGGVAARASCPVVVVAPEWDPTQEHGRIVVGLKSVDNAAGLLAAGLAAAHERNAELVVVHAWKLQSGYDDIIANRADAVDYGRRETSLIEPVINDLRRSYPEVAVRIEVLHAQPTFALVNASASADRLLLARPAHAGILHHLGAVSRAVLHEARCPVEILPRHGNQGAEHVAT